MHDAEPILTQIEAAIAGHPELEVVLLFGSLATGLGRSDSDVDVAVRAAHPWGRSTDPSAPLSTGWRQALISTE
jgi:predicted nucleotidyltransferase